MADPTLSDLDTRLRVVEAKLGITPPVDPPVDPPPAGNPPFFTKARWLWDPIPANPVLDAASGQVAIDLAPGSHVLNTIAYGVTIRYAGTADPRVAVKFSENWGNNPHNGQPMPLPGGSVPLAPGGDKHVAILDLPTNKVWSLWAASNGGKNAAWGSVVPADGDGTEPAPMTSTGSRISRLACVVTEQEVAAGVIPHALFFSSSKVGSGFRYPAGKSDQSGSERLQEGMRIQLDPAFDVAGQSWPKYVKAIARALQVYGAYCGDGGGATVAVIAEFTGTSATTGYRSAGVSGDYSNLSQIPWSRVRVLRQWDGK